VTRAPVVAAGASSGVRACEWHRDAKDDPGKQTGNELAPAEPQHAGSPPLRRSAPQPSPHYARTRNGSGELTPLPTHRQCATASARRARPRNGRWRAPCADAGMSSSGGIVGRGDHMPRTAVAQPSPSVATGCREERMADKRSTVQLIDAYRGAVVEVGTKSTTQAPHRLWRAASVRYSHCRAEPVVAGPRRFARRRTLAPGVNSGLELALAGCAVPACHAGRRRVRKLDPPANPADLRRDRVVHPTGSPPLEQARGQSGSCG
jgi:hypothetical protein